MSTTAGPENAAFAPRTSGALTAHGAPRRKTRNSKWGCFLRRRTFGGQPKYPVHRRKGAREKKYSHELPPEGLTSWRFYFRAPRFLAPNPKIAPPEKKKRNRGENPVCFAISRPLALSAPGSLVSPPPRPFSPRASFIANTIVFFCCAPGGRKKVQRFTQDFPAFAGVEPQLNRCREAWAAAVVLGRRLGRLRAQEGLDKTQPKAASGDRETGRQSRLHLQRRAREFEKAVVPLLAELRAQRAVEDKWGSLQTTSSEVAAAAGVFVRSATKLSSAATSEAGSLRKNRNKRIFDSRCPLEGATLRTGKRAREEWGACLPAEFQDAGGIQEMGAALQAVGWAKVASLLELQKLPATRETISRASSQLVDNVPISAVRSGGFERAVFVSGDLFEALAALIGGPDDVRPSPGEEQRPAGGAIQDYPIPMETPGKKTGAGYDVDKVAAALAEILEGGGASAVLKDSRRESQPPRTDGITLSAAQQGLRDEYGVDVFRTTI